MTRGDVPSSRGRGSPDAAGRIASVLVVVMVLVASLEAGTVPGGTAVAVPFYAAGLVILRRLGWSPIGALLVAILIDPTFTDRHGSVVWSVVLVVYMLIPASFVAAITRYHLYDIDRIVSRTVTYALVALVVTVVCSVLVVLLPRLLGESDQLIVAASTLVAAAVFNPARRRIQRSVDRRFNRSAYDLELETDRVARKLTDLTDLSSVEGELDSVVGRALAPHECRVDLRATMGVGSARHECRP